MAFSMISDLSGLSVDSGITSDIVINNGGFLHFTKYK